MKTDDLFDPLKKEKITPEPKIRVLQKPEEGACGGTEEVLDLSAPKTIRSREMTRFSARSAFFREGPEALCYLSAFACRAGDGVFLFLETADGETRRPSDGAWVWVREDIFPSLVTFVQEFDLAKENGRRAFTYGLPEDFGGSVDIRYASGEKIGFSSNQSPVLSREAGEKIVVLFRKAMKGESLKLPELSRVREIRFDEKRPDGGYTHASLSVENGIYTVRRTRKFSDPKVYESRRELPPERYHELLEIVNRCGMLAWNALPERDYTQREKKSLTFRFSQGEEISVPGDRALPDPLADSFFQIELELAVKS